MNFAWRFFSGNKIGFLKKNPEDLESGENQRQQLDVPAEVSDVGAGQACKERLLYGKCNILCLANRANTSSIDNNYF